MAGGGVNKVILIGNLGADPDVRAMPSGEQVATIRIATSESWKDKNTGEPRERTEWHRVVFFRRLADIVAQYLRKGSKVYVEGRLQTRKWQGQDGQDRYTTEIIADNMQMLDSRGSGGTASFADGPGAAAQGGIGPVGGGQPGGRPVGGVQSGSGPAPSGGAAPPMDKPDFDDDVPF